MANFSKPQEAPSCPIVPVVSIVLLKELYFLKKHIMVICSPTTCKGINHANQTI